MKMFSRAVVFSPMYSVSLNTFHHPFVKQAIDLTSDIKNHQPFAVTARQACYKEVIMFGTFHAKGIQGYKDI